jgi:pyruvate/2-oxoglutarate dehydrogenase complex dihydrolipoamide dehydrogenase (E3) component
MMERFDLIVIGTGSGLEVSAAAAEAGGASPSSRKARSAAPA